MAFILPNGKELKRSKGIKNKISPAKVATIHKKLLSILFDVSETTVSRQCSALKLSLRNPYAVREYIEWKMEYNEWELGSKWKTTHANTLTKPKEQHERKLHRITARDRKKWIKPKDSRNQYLTSEEYIQAKDGGTWERQDSDQTSPAME